MDEFNLSKLVNIIVQEVVVQQIIVNGTPQQVKEKAFVMCCPECKRIIYQFQPGMSYIDCVKEVMVAKDKLEQNFRYCATCGQKLSYDYDIYDEEEKNV